MSKVANFFDSQGIVLALEQKRQMLVLDKQFETCESQVKILQAENLKLRADVEPLKKEVERLKNQVEEKETSRHDDSLDDMATKLLQAIANSDGRMPRRATGKHFGLSPAQTDYYFDILTEKQFIIPTVTATRQQEMLYAATAEGRKYLAKKGIL